MQAAARLVLLLAVLAGCAAAPAEDAGDFSTLPGWQSDHVADGVAAFLRGCRHLDQRFQPACAAAATMPGGEASARLFVQRYFRPQYVGTNAVTGYFELTLPGARTSSPATPVPVLRPPADPARWGAADIARGALRGQGLELVWLENPADLFFLMLQGSGRVQLPDGAVVRLGTATSNGRRQVPTAQLFADAPVPGRDLSIPGIRAWIARNPQNGYARLARDQSYVFFRETPDLLPQLGPRGALGAPLTPGRSVAVDPRAVPLGEMVWLDGRDTRSGQPIQRLVAAQDTGDQIEGAGRIDLFYGAGPAAEAAGGREFSQGRVWRLVPR